MTGEQRVMTLLVEANPVPDLDLLDLSVVDGTGYLAELDRRSSEVTQLKEHPTTAEVRMRRPLFYSMAAVAAVVLGIAAWLGFSREDTTMVGNGTEVANQFAGAVSAGSTDLSEYLTDDATIAPITAPLDDDLASFWAGLETELTLSDCAQTGSTGSIITCDYRWSDVIREAQSRPEFGKATFLVEGSKISAISLDFDAEASRWIEAGDPVIDYMEWLNTEHPGWELELDWIGVPVTPPFGYKPFAHDDPVRNANYADVLTRYLDGYEAYLAATGGVSG